MKLPFERQHHIVNVKKECLNYCFIKVSDNILVFIMVFVDRFGRCRARNVVAGYRPIHFIMKGLGVRVSLIMYRLSLTL